MLYIKVGKLHDSVFKKSELIGCWGVAFGVKDRCIRGHDDYDATVLTHEVPGGTSQRSSIVSPGVAALVAASLSQGHWHRRCIGPLHCPWILAMRLTPQLLASSFAKRSYDELRRWTRAGE